MGEFLGVLRHITNKLTGEAYPEDDHRNKLKDRIVIGLIGISERKQPGKQFIKIIDPAPSRAYSLKTGLGELQWKKDGDQLVFESEQTIWEFEIKAVKGQKELRIVKGSH